MCKFRWVSLAVLCLCSTGLWAGGAPYVVVSTTDGSIYRIDTTNGVANAPAPVLLYFVSGAAWSMVIGPDNSSPTGKPLLYACDASGNTIIRFDPSSPVSNVNPADTVYSAGVGGYKGLRCGRITSSGAPNSLADPTAGVGDLVVTSTSGLLVFSAITWVPRQSAGLPLANPSSTLSATTNGGIAQKNNGNLLAVDIAGNKVYRTLAPSSLSGPAMFSAGAPLLAVSGATLSSPFGIARRSDGEVFVSNQGGTPNVTHFGLTFGNAALNQQNCEQFKGSNKGVPAFMQMSLDDTLYLAGANGTKGFVQSLNAQTCSSASLQSLVLATPALGIAIPPTSATLTLPYASVSQNAVLGNGTALFSFGYSAMQYSQIAQPCSGTAVVNLFSPAAINSFIGWPTPTVPADPAVNLGLDGFEIVYATGTVNPPTGVIGCGALDGTKNIQMSNFVPQSVVNPEIFVCDDSAVPQGCSPTAGAGGNETVTQLGAWPLGGYLPQDLTSGGSKSLKSQLFMANLHQNTSDTGTFCLFQSPVNNTFSPNTATGPTFPWDVSLASSFPAGKSIPIKFKLGTGTQPGACQNAPFITDATGLLSVAQIVDSKGNPTFVPMGLISNGSSGLLPPTFKPDGNNQYLFNWDSSTCILPGGTTQICPRGTYTVTVLFLTNNTVNQTIYDVQTTVVILK
jgi:hypothetical protein